MSDSRPHPLIELRTRWTPAATDTTNEQLLRGLQEGSPFGTTADGYVDLRGLAIKVFVKGVRLSRIDFTACVNQWAGQFDYATATDCLFLGATLGTNIGTAFSKCNFTGAKLKGAVLRGQFSHCDFTNADLSSSLGVQVSFGNCSFDHANLKKAQLTRCHFTHCRFLKAKFGSGSFANSQFHACDISTATLANTVMEGMKVET